MIELIGISGDNARKIINILLEHVVHQSVHVRMLAIRYAIDVFPMQDVESKFVLLLATADIHQDIRDVAEEALLLSPKQNNNKLQDTTKITMQAHSHLSETQETTITPGSPRDSEQSSSLMPENEQPSEFSIIAEKTESDSSCDGHVKAPDLVSVISMLSNKFGTNTATSQKRRADGTPGISSKDTLVASNDAETAITGTILALPYHEQVVKRAIEFVLRCLHIQGVRTSNLEEYLRCHGSQKGRLLLLRQALYPQGINCYGDTDTFPQHDQLLQNRLRVLASWNLTESTSVPLEKFLDILAMAFHASAHVSFHASILQSLLEISRIVPDVLAKWLFDVHARLLTNLSSPRRDICETSAE